MYQLLPQHVPATISNVALTHQVDPSLVELSQKEVFVVRISIFIRPTYHLNKRFFLKNNYIVHIIVSPLLFKYLNVFDINIWERVKPGPSKKVSQKLILTIFGKFDLPDRVMPPLC